MFRSKVSRLIVLGALLVVSGVPRPSVATATEDSDTEAGGVVAWFEGRWINLADGWSEAAACTSDGRNTVCYRTEAEMDQTSRSAARSVVPFASCSSSLRLYRSTSYGGAVLQLTTRGVYINLASYGFDNDTSSYRVGACTSYFYDGASGSGSLYPGATGAGAAAASMLAGWDNRISSVYIA